MNPRWVLPEAEKLCRCQMVGGTGHGASLLGTFSNGKGSRDHHFGCLTPGTARDPVQSYLFLNWAGSKTLVIIIKEAKLHDIWETMGDCCNPLVFLEFSTPIIPTQKILEPCGF